MINMAKFKEHGEGGDTLIEYISQDDERIEVVSGNYNIKYAKSRGFFKGPYYRSTRVYVNGEKQLELDYGELPGEEIPRLRVKLEELAEEKVSSEEIISAIETYASNYQERRLLSEDDPELFDHDFE